LPRRYRSYILALIKWPVIVHYASRLSQSDVEAPPPLDTIAAASVMGFAEIYGE
jgi:hypothetical protein